MNRQIRTPGDPGGNPHEVARAGEDAPAPRRVAALPAPRAEETPEQTIARLEAEVAMLRASDGSRTAPRPLAPKDPRDPFAEQRVDSFAREIDPTTIGKAVLARDGWVVPAFVPAAPIKKVVAR